MDIKQEYREETNKEPYAEELYGNPSGSYSDEYVVWLQSKLHCYQGEVS